MALLARARMSEAAALEQLIGEQQTYVYSIALGLARNADDAADVMQEACIKLSRALPSYRGESRFSTWLYRLVVNAGLDLLRRRGRTLSLDEEGSERDIEAPTDDSLERIERTETKQRVRLAVASLPPGQRLALTMQYFQDLQYEDIAEIMGLPVNTVKSHIRRGKVRLAQQLADLAPTAAGARSAS